MVRLTLLALLVLSCLQVTTAQDDIGTCIQRKDLEELLAKFANPKEKKNWEEKIQTLIARAKQQAQDNDISVSAITTGILLVFPLVVFGISRAPQLKWVQILIPHVQTQFFAVSSLIGGGISAFVDVDLRYALLFVAGVIAYLVYAGISSHRDKRHMYSASVSFNYFRPNNTFSFKAWKEIPLKNIRISDAEAHWWVPAPKEGPFFKLDYRIATHMKVIKAIGLQISEMFSFQWTEHICGGVPYHFTNLIIGLVYEDDAQACGPDGSPILQWRLFVISEEDLDKCDAEGVFDDECFPSVKQKANRYQKIKQMKELYQDKTTKKHFVTISVPTAKTHELERNRTPAA